MNKMVVAVFENENSAFEGLSALKDLHKKGDITLYATAVVSKDLSGQLHLNTAADEGPIGFATGLFTGSLLGLLGGPIGMAIGAGAGMIAGLIYDGGNDEVNMTFVEEISAALKNGKTALIAEVDEDWTVPIDTKLGAFDAMVFRRLKYEVAEDQLARESEAIAAELDSLKQELKESSEENKATIKSAIAKLQNKAQVTNELIRKKLNDSKMQLDAKVNTLELQMRQARESRKAKIENRISKMKNEYALRAEKLKAAAVLISEALHPKVESQKSAKAEIV